MKKKIIFIVILLLIMTLTIFLIFKLRSDDKTKMTSNEFYAVVRESYAGYALVKPLDEDINYDVLSISVKDLKVGDIIRLKIKDIKEIYPPEAEVEEIEVLQTDKISELEPDIKEEVTTKITEQIKNDITTSQTTSVSKNETTTTKKKDIKNAD